MANAKELIERRERVSRVIDAADCCVQAHAAYHHTCRVLRRVIGESTYDTVHVATMQATEAQRDAIQTLATPERE